MTGTTPAPAALVEAFESRLLLSGAFDTVGLTALRADAAFTGIDGSGVGIAVLDTGLFSTHPDLRPNFTAWYDAVTRSEGGTPFDHVGHGTHVAGTAAGRNPQIGVATRARLISVRVLPDEDEAQPRYDTVAEGLRWVIDHQAQYNIRVVNMSLGTRQNLDFVPSDTGGEAGLIRRLEQMGVTVVSASGNSYADFASPGAAAPAVFSTLSVASTWEDNGVGDSFPFFAGGGGPYAAFEREGVRDRLAASSQRSTLPNQVAAPGQTIFSSWNNEGGNLYNTISGTSMASPLVTGMVALMQDAAKTFGGRYLSTSEVVSIVRGTADTIIDSNVTTNGRIEIDTETVEGLPETGLSFKRVNIYNAIRRIRQMMSGMTDADDRISQAVELGSTDGNVNLGGDGAIGADGEIDAGATDVDIYRFTLASRGNVTVTLSNTAGGTPFDSFLRLFRADGSPVSSDDNSAGGGYSRIITPILEPGVYYVGVSAAGNQGYDATTAAGKASGNSRGDYRIVVSLSNPDPNGVATGAVPVDKLPNFFPGNIGADRGVPVGSKDVDFFLITAPDTGRLIIDIDTSGFGGTGVDAVLRVFDENFNQVAINDDRAPGDVDPFLSVMMVKGQRYYVAVADFQNQAFDPRDPFSRSSAGTGGDYDLTLSFDNGDADGTVFAATAILPTQNVDGVVGSDAGMTVGADGTKDVDFYKFTPGRAGVIDLRLTSPDQSLRGNLRLWVYDAADDDVVEVGEQTGASPVLRAFVQPGTTYYVSVTGEGNGDFDWFAPATGTGGDTGSYRLESTLRVLGFAKPRTDDSVRNNTPQPVSVGSEVSDEIGEDNGFITGADDIDVYRFTPASTVHVIFRTLTNREDATDTVMRVFDAAGNQIAFNDDVSSSDLGSRVDIVLQGGQTYYIGINGYSPQATQYNVLTGENAPAGKQGSYTFLVMQGPGPEVETSGNGIVIVSGDATPSVADFTRFPGATVGAGAEVRVFQIRNTGDRPLLLTGTPRVTVSGPAAGDFTIIQQPRRRLNPGTTATFQVRFTPSAAGARRAVITIATNDLDEPAYTFTVAGQGLLRPEIEVAGGGVVIPNGDDSPRAEDGTRFGTPRGGMGVIRLFQIRNTGRRPLNLTGTPRVSIQGPDASDFMVISQPVTSVAGGKAATFRIRFRPGSVGPRSAQVVITSNDPDEALYTFTIAGTGTA